MERFHFPEHRHLYLVSHLLLRTKLSCYSDILPKTWRFVSNDHGKPRLDSDLGLIPLCLSISYTKGPSVLGVTREEESGVDVEQTVRSANAAELSRH